MKPFFNKKTIDVLAKRAAFKCSNPDCRISTVGPNVDPQKTTIIGEAAHIFGARLGAKRYNHQMTDTTRAEITNSIWLCRNCHKLIDTDEQKYSSDLLFAWREQHEKYIQSRLGNATDKILFKKLSTALLLFKDFPPLIRRIVIDKPDGWEWRLTAELMRYLNRPLFRKIDDLHNGLYTKSLVHISDDDIIPWVQKRLAEASNIINPMVSLVDRLNKCWDSDGESENAEEIYHVCFLIRDYLDQVIKYEEQIYFTNVSEEFKNLIDLFKNLIGTQVKKLADIPNVLDKAVSLIGTDHSGTDERPYKIEKTIVFDLPVGWEEEMNRQLNEVEKIQSQGYKTEGFNIWSALLIGALLFGIINLFF